mmetsp:Transcript_9997/g.9939  ORF Transcript_9997/g.9939 Transcript_9997/m.9939 type:complete len:98 (+) Transcript_9997:316-609(+)
MHKVLRVAFIHGGDHVVILLQNGRLLHALFIAVLCHLLLLSQLYTNRRVEAARVRVIGNDHWLLLHSLALDVRLGLSLFILFLFSLRLPIILIFKIY